MEETEAVGYFIADVGVKGGVGGKGEGVKGKWILVSFSSAEGVIGVENGLGTTLEEV